MTEAESYTLDEGDRLLWTGHDEDHGIHGFVHEWTESGYSVRWSGGHITAHLHRDPSPNIVVTGKVNHP